MIELIEGLPAPVVGLRASGTVSAEDYERELVPAIEAMIAAHDKVRVLYVLGDDFDGYSFGAAWQDTKLGLGNLRHWERCAIVTDADWIENAVKALGWMMPGEIRAFDDDDYDDAREWIVEGLTPAA